MDKPNDADGGINAPDLAHFLHHDHSGDTHPHASGRPPAGSAVQGDVLRDVEKALVERIADVDDDRRRTTLQMQKAWQTHCREIDDRLLRQRRVLIGLVVSLFVIVIGGLAWFYLGLADLRRTMDTRLASVEQASVEPAAVQAAASPDQIDALGQLVDDRLLVLAERQGVLEAELVRQQGLLRSQANDSEVSGAISTRLAAIEHRQQTLAEELKALTAQLTTVPAEPAVPSISDKAQPAVLEPAQQGADRVRVGNRPYALQLLGAFDRDAVLELARRDFPGSQVYLREETYRGRPWYVLIRSLHPSREAALDALAALPERLADTDVWIRRLPEDTLLQPIDLAKSSGNQDAGG
jgi:DamX protein